eukprot:scaffold8475_cov76-Amphora_coffeaeformis.AAC.1
MVDRNACFAPNYGDGDKNADRRHMDTCLDPLRCIFVLERKKSTVVAAESATNTPNTKSIKKIRKSRVH